MNLSLGKKNTKPAASALPDKTDLNLVPKEDLSHLKFTFIGIGVAAVAFILFIVLGVIKPYAELNRMKSEAQSTQTQINALKTQNADFDQVKAEYERTAGDAFMNADEKLVPAKDEILAMIDEDLVPTMTVTSIAVTKNQISVITTNATLQQVSEALNKLQSDARNTYVNVTTTTAASSGANTKTDKVNATFVIQYAGGAV